MINLKDYNINLHLIRHGSYIPTSVGGWSKEHLSNDGIKEVEKLLTLIDNDYDIFISSDLARAKDTASILNKKLNMDIIYNPDFREINSGLLNDVGIEEFKEKYLKYYIPNMSMEDIFPEGESFNTFYERIKDSFMQLLNEYKNKKILLITHGGVINIILSLIKGIKYDKNLDFGIKTGSITKLC